MDQTLKNLSEYNIWANNRVVEAFSALQDIPVNSKQLFSHVLNAQAIWIARITGTQSPVKVFDVHEMPRLIELAQETSNKLAELVESSDEKELEREIEYTNTQGNFYINRVWDIFTHVFNHATYHRAQVAKDMRACGYEPVNTDYITYCRETK